MTALLRRNSTPSEYDTAELFLDSPHYTSGRLILTPRQWHQFTVLGCRDEFRGQIFLTEGPPKGIQENEFGWYLCCGVLAIVIGGFLLWT